MSIRLQRSVLLFAASNEFSHSFKWECSSASFHFHFSFAEFSETSYCSPEGLFLCKQAPLYFEGGLLFIFGMGVWIFAVSFLSVRRLLTP